MVIKSTFNERGYIHIYITSLWLFYSWDPLELQLTADEAQSTHRIVCLVFVAGVVPRWLPARTIQYILICWRSSSVWKVPFLCVGVFLCEASCSVFGWQCSYVCNLAHNQWCVWHRLCVGLRLARFGSLHVHRVVYVCAVCESVRAAGVEQHLANVFVSQTVENGVQERAARCWHQGGIGVQRRARCISQQSPEGERHPATHKHTEDQD